MNKDINKKKGPGRPEGTKYYTQSGDTLVQARISNDLLKEIDHCMELDRKMNYGIKTPRRLFVTKLMVKGCDAVRKEFDAYKKLHNNCPDTP